MAGDEGFGIVNPAKVGSVRTACRIATVRRALVVSTPVYRIGIKAEVVVGRW